MIEGPGFDRPEKQVIERKIVMIMLIVRVKIGKIPLSQKGRRDLTSDLSSGRIYERTPRELGSVSILLRRVGRHGSAGGIEIRSSTAGKT